jgi:hypothetical protein
MDQNKPGNVVPLASASALLRDEFIEWQCRIRQIAVRQDAGRPSPGMRPRVISLDGTEISPGIVVLIVPKDPSHSTTQFRYQFLKTADPIERFEKIVEIQAAEYFQHPENFSDVITALFGPGSEPAARLVDMGQCILEFTQYSQGYRIPCGVNELDEQNEFFQATYWHNSMYNPNLSAGIRVLAFKPDWSATQRREI